MEEKKDIISKYLDHSARMKKETLFFQWIEKKEENRVQFKQGMTSGHAVTLHDS